MMVSPGAIAIEADDQTDPGLVAFFDADGNFLGSVEVGALPDMLTFTPDGQKILVANEGEPDGGVDPKGSVSIIDLSGGIGAATVQTADFTAFDAQQADLEAAGLRIFEGKLLSDDVEPEYIAVSDDGTQAFITLQEANAVAMLDIASATITDIQPLGAKDHSENGNGLDPSDSDGAINIDEVPVFGLYMPDAIASYERKGTNYYVTANEGDARDEDDRVGDLALDPTAFPDAAKLQLDENLGRLEVSTIDGDGDYDQLFAYGARSFSIWDEDGNLVFDRGDMIAQITAELTPELFNANDGDPAEFDSRSDAKGAEPESVVVGEVDGEVYTFVGLERAGGGVMVFEITNPKKVEFVQYVRTDGDIAPEDLAFISAEDSPTDVPLLAVSNEVSETTSVYEISFEGERIVGNNRDNVLEGTAGDDRTNGRRGDDDMEGNRGDDNVFGGFGNDDIEGNRGDDNLFGEGGNDDMDGGRGNDNLDGGDGDDLMTGGRGDDDYDGGDGIDTVIFSSDRENYEIDFEAGTVTDLRGAFWADGTDTFVNVEFLQFRDETVEVPTISGSAFTLQILHASDLEGGVDAIGRAPNFAAIVDTLEDEYENTVLISAGDNYIPGPLFNAADDGSTFNPLFEGFYNQFFGLIDVSVVDPSADMDGNGFYSNDELDAFILANPRVNASDVYVVDVNGDGTPDYFDEIGRVDISIMNILGFDATAVGNHEFDNGSDAFENIINYDSEEGNSLSGVGVQSILDEFGPDAVNYLQEVDWPGAQFPYLSANLDFSGDGDIGSLFTPEILKNTAFLSDLLSAHNNPLDPAEAASDSNDSKIAPATIIKENGEYIGVVGATTQLLESISSPTGTSVIGGPFTTNDMQALADILQPIIDDLIAGDAASGRPPINKIILTSHLQQIELETELAGLLTGVDVIIAGGSDTLLADETDRLRAGDTADDTYPVLAESADGKPVAIVSTDGEYSYVGRLVIDFDADGNIIPESIDADVSGAYATDDQGVLDVTGAGDIDTAIADSDKATDVEKLTDAAQQVVTERDGNVFGETAPEDDERIQNLSVRDDTVIDDSSGSAPGIVINEIRTDQTSTDNDEYFELYGEPNASLDGLYYIVIVIGDGTGGSGVIENVTDLSGFSLDANGFFTAAEGTFSLGSADLTTTLAFENNDNVTHLLVRDFTGAVGDDLDTDDDGTPEMAPWSEVLDSVALIETVGSGDLVYSATQVGPNGSFVPGHIFRLPDGTGDWQIGAFDPAAGSDTPSAANSDVTTAPLALAIYEIQGADHRSPYEGVLVATIGIVTAIDSGGFYIQDAAGDGDIATSDGIYVLGDTTGIAVGDEVAVEGSVEEQQFGDDLSLTRIIANSTTVNSSGNTVPDPVVLGVERIQPDAVIDDDGLTSFDPELDAIDFLESLEGMLVEVNDPLAVAGTNRFDEVALIANRGGEFGPGILNAVISDGDFNPEILLTNDSIATQPNVVTGDRFDTNPVGVIDYSFGAYKLELTETPSVISGGGYQSCGR